MSRVVRKEWYARVNACWPADVPALTAPEAIRAGRKLYRFAMGDTWQPEPVVSSGNRHTWIRHGVMYVNPERGWLSLVHNLSHALCDADGPHGADHARLEMRMIKHVVKSGWLAGALKDKPKPARPESDTRVVKYARTLACLGLWERKHKRAENAIKNCAVVCGRKNDTCAQVFVRNWIRKQLKPKP